MTYVVDVECVAARPMAAVRFHSGVSEIGERIGDAFSTVDTYLAREGIAPAGAAVARYVPAGDGSFDVEAGFIVARPVPGDDQVIGIELRGGEVAHTTHIGRYEELPNAYAAMHLHAHEMGRELDDGAAMWEEYWSPPESPVEETRTEIYWPLLVA